MTSLTGVRKCRFYSEKNKNHTIELQVTTSIRFDDQNLSDAVVKSSTSIYINCRTG